MMSSSYHNTLIMIHIIINLIRRYHSEVGIEMLCSVVKYVKHKNQHTIIWPIDFRPQLKDHPKNCIGVYCIYEN